MLTQVRGRAELGSRAYGMRGTCDSVVRVEGAWCSKPYLVYHCHAARAPTFWCGRIFNVRQGRRVSTRVDLYRLSSHDSHFMKFFKPFFRNDGPRLV